MLRNSFFLVDPTLDLLFLRIIFVFFVLEAMGLGCIKKHAFCQTLCFLYKGEQKVIDQGVEKFSIGNKEILAGIVQNQEFLIKGKALGVTDLKYWKENKIYSKECYVLTKKESLKIEYLKKNLKNFSIIGFYPKVSIKGVIHSFKDYLFLKKEEKNLFFKLKISKNFKQELVKKIYEDIFSLGKNFFCFFEEIHLKCEGSFPLKKEIEEKYFIHWNYLKKPLLLSIKIKKKEKIVFHEVISILEKEKFQVKKGYKNESYFMFEGDYSEGVLKYRCDYIEEKRILLSEQSHKSISYNQELLLSHRNKKYLLGDDLSLVVELNHGKL